MNRIFKNIIKFQIYTAIAASFTIPVKAQYNQSISVEGNYVPEVIKLERINTFPQLHKFSLETTPLNYEQNSVAADFRARLLPMPATGWRDTRTFSNNRGYLDAGIGSWLNSTLSAGYRFVDSEKSKAGGWLQHNSTSLWKPKVSAQLPNDRQYRYDETIGLYASHDFSGKGSLSAAASYHFGAFNYYGYTPLLLFTNDNSKYKMPEQILNDISASAGWKSKYKADGINWYANIDYRSFGYNRYYRQLICNENIEDEIIRKECNSELVTLPGSKEQTATLSTGLQFPLSSTSSIGVDLELQSIIYDIICEQYHFFRNIPSSTETEWTCDFSATIVPAYTFRRDNLLVRAGVNINGITLPHGEDASHLRLAPDVKLDFNANPVNFYLHLLGGVKPHTMANGYELDYYQNPRFLQTLPEYTPFDGKFGINFGPFAGVSAGFDFSYRVTQNQLLGGWYQFFMNTYDNVSDRMPRNTIWTDGASHCLEYDYDSSSSFRTANLHGFSLGLNLSYDAGRYFKFSGKGNYQPQKGNIGYFNGYDRPRWTADIEALTNPWSTLKFKLACQYRGVRNIYTKAKVLDTLNRYDTILVGMRLRDIVNLNFGASYGLKENLDLWFQADNLLNRHTTLLPDLPTQGISLCAGISLAF